MNPGQPSNFTEGAICIVELEHVAGKLVMIAVFIIGFVAVPAVEGCFGFETGIMFRDHICHKDLRIVIVIDIGHISPHGSSGNTRHHCCQCFPESSIAIV